MADARKPLVPKRRLQSPRDSLKQYLDCQACGLCDDRKNVVLGRGDIGAQLMFIGEAPGKVEDMRGKPFVGPSGKLLEQALRDAAVTIAREQFLDTHGDGFLTTADPDGFVPAHYITNIVSCFPKDSKGKPRPPTGEEVIACMPRLEAEIAMVNPRVVVFLGKTAATHGKRYFPHGHHLYHPAYILRSGGAGTPVYLEFVRSLMEVLQLCASH